MALPIYSNNCLTEDCRFIGTIVMPNRHYKHFDIYVTRNDQHRSVWDNGDKGDVLVCIWHNNWGNGVMGYIPWSVKYGREFALTEDYNADMIREAIRLYDSVNLSNG